MNLQSIKTKEQMDAAVQEARTKKLPASQLIKLKCLDCSAYDIKEVKNCPATTCPLWSKRGYYPSSKDDVFEPETEEVVFEPESDL